jgi:hypothetical protein
MAQIENSIEVASTIEHTIVVTLLFKC